jgi:hypothetical protein
MSCCRGAGALFVALTLALGSTPAEEPLTLPRTIDRVWYRSTTPKGGLGGKREGDLRITADTLELSSNKEELVVPLGSVRMISYGPLGSDVDTEWVVIGLEREGERSRLGLRDGSRLGYGGRTPEIYDALVRVARERGLGQYSAPEGFAPYARIARQVALAVPQEFHALQHGLAVLRELNVTGTVVFSPAIPQGTEGSGIPEPERVQALASVTHATAPAWILDIREAKRGMRCSGFTESGRAELQGWIAEHELLGRGLVGPAGLEPTAVDRCAGVRGTWHAAAGAEPIVVDVRAASDDEFVYVLALRTHADREADERRTFEQGLGTLRFAVARARPKGAL